MWLFSGIIELNEQEEVLKSIGRFNFAWTDEKLRWDPALETGTYDGKNVNYKEKGFLDPGRMLYKVQFVSVSSKVS